MDEIERRLAAVEENLAIKNGEVWALRSALLVLLPLTPGVERVLAAAREAMARSVAEESFDGDTDRQKQYKELINETALEKMDEFIDAIQSIRKACAKRAEEAAQERQASPASPPPTDTGPIP